MRGRDLEWKVERAPQTKGIVGTNDDMMTMTVIIMTIMVMSNIHSSLLYSRYFSKLLNI